MLKCSYMFVILTIITYNQIFSQDCPPGYSSWLIDQAYFEDEPYKWHSSTEYYKNDIGNNTFEIKVVESLQHPSININYDFTDEEHKILQYRAILKVLMELHNCQPQEQFTFIFFEEVNCYVEKACYIEVLSEDQIHCVDDGWTGPYPEFLNQDQTWVVEDKQKVVCGTGCCKTTIVAECRTASTHGPFYPYIVSSTNESYIDCNTSVIDCFSNEEKPCQSECGN